MQGFLFERVRPSIDALHGWKVTRVYAIAQDRDAARKLVAEQYPEQKLHLIEEGLHILHTARAVGVEDGAAKIVNG